MKEDAPKKIILYGSNGVVRAYALVDSDDYEALMKFRWSLVDGYAKRTVRLNKKTITISMHREIVSCPTNMVVDHINRDRLDNRKANLRICTRSDNVRNRSKTQTITGFKGVFRIKYKESVYFGAQIEFCGKKVHLGSFREGVAAAQAYDSAAAYLFGDFASTNFPIKPDYKLPEKVMQKLRHAKELTK